MQMLILYQACKQLLPTFTHRIRNVLLCSHNLGNYCYLCIHYNGHSHEPL